MRNNMVTVLAEDYVRMGRAKGLSNRADHVPVRRAQRHAAQPRRVRHVAGFRRRRRDPGGVRLQLPGLGLHAPERGEQPGLPADAGAVPDDHRRRARRRPDLRRPHRRGSTRGPGARHERHHPGRPDRHGGGTAGGPPASAVAACSARSAPTARPWSAPSCCWSSWSSRRFRSCSRRCTTRTRHQFDLGLPPSAEHWLGTTAFGQDIYAQLIYGTRETLDHRRGGRWAGATVLSVLIGVSAAYLGGSRTARSRR